MSEDDRYEMFGGPTETLAAEAVFGFRKEHGRWPLLTEGVAYLSESSELAGDLEEAERRMMAAIQSGEVVVKLFARGRGQAWGVQLDEATMQSMERRYLDATMERRESEEMW